jgi:DDE superfamily endonuclease
VAITAAAISLTNAELQYGDLDDMVLSPDDGEIDSYNVARVNNNEGNTSHPTNKKLKRCSRCQKPGHQWQTCVEPKIRSVRFTTAHANENGGDDENGRWAIFPRRGGKLVSFDEKRMSLRVLHVCMKEHIASINGKISTRNPTSRAYRYSGVSKRVIRRLHKKWEETRQIESTYAQKQTRRGKYERPKHWSRHWIAGIRETATALNLDGRPVTTRSILDAMDLEGQYGMRMSEMTLRRVLLEIGYAYKDVGKAACNFTETAEIREWRMRYLQERRRIRADEPDTIEIWLDESYCNQYHVARRSWYRENDTVKRGNKGKRWIIVHAGGSCGWVGKPFVFPAKKKKGDSKSTNTNTDTNTTDDTAVVGDDDNDNCEDDNDNCEDYNDKDYHENMNADVFRDYFEQLCKWMKKKYPGQKVVFHMDNAGYHKKTDGLDKALSSLNKTELVAWLKKQGAKNEEVDGKRRKEYLYQLAQEDRFKGKPIPETIVKRYDGYRVLWIPPYHPMLNPIEEAWGLTKGFVARNNNGSSFQNVRSLIFLGFIKVTPETWEKLVRRTHANEDKMVAEHHIAIITLKDINNMVIDIDDDNEDDSEEDEYVDEDENDDEDEHEGKSDGSEHDGSESDESGESTTSENWQLQRKYIKEKSKENGEAKTLDDEDMKTDDDYDEDGSDDDVDGMERIKFKNIFEDDVVHELLK